MLDSIHFRLGGNASAQTRFYGIDPGLQIRDLLVDIIQKLLGGFPLFRLTGNRIQSCFFLLQLFIYRAQKNIIWVIRSLAASCAARSASN